MKTQTNTFNLFEALNLPQTHLPYFNEILIGKTYDVPAPINDRAKIMFQCEQDTTNNVTHYYIEHVYTILVSPNGNLCMLQCHKGKYYFHPYYGYSRSAQRINQRIINERTKLIPEPNQIGVFTDKKVNEWLNYCDAYINAINELVIEFNAKRAEIDKEVEKFITSVPDAKVQRNKEGNHIWVNTTLFEVIFTIHTDSNYLETKTRFNGNLSDIANIENVSFAH